MTEHVSNHRDSGRTMRSDFKKSKKLLQPPEEDVAKRWSSMAQYWTWQTKRNRTQQKTLQWTPSCFQSFLIHFSSFQFSHHSSLSLLTCSTATHHPWPSIYWTFFLQCFPDCLQSFLHITFRLFSTCFFPDLFLDFVCFHSPLPFSCLL